MAIPTRTVNGHGDSEAYVSVLASMAVMLCMIVSLMGIKLWWFKHRLTFEQNSTSNGAAGGSQPTVAAPAKRSAKDKRLSQQFHDADMVHGVFRKRQEDDVIIERPKELPPVRVERLYSQGAQRAMPLPSNRMGNLEFPTPPPPPTREPPRPPIYENEMHTAPQTATEPPQTAAIFQKVQVDAGASQHHDPIEPARFVSERNSYQATSPALSNEQQAFFAISGNPPKPPKRLNRSQSSDVHGGRNKFLKAKSPSEPDNMSGLAQRRPTGYLRPPTEGNLREMQENFGTLSVEEFGARQPRDGYVKYEEYDVEGLQGITDDWRHNRRDDYTDGQSASDYFATEYEADGRTLSTTTLADRRPKDSDEFDWLKGDVGGTHYSYHEQEEKAGPTKLVTFQYNDDDDDDDDDEAEGASASALKLRRPTGFVRDTDFDLSLPRSQVTFANSSPNDGDDGDDEDGLDSPLKIRRPTGYVRDGDFDLTLARSVTFAAEENKSEHDKAGGGGGRESPFQVRRPTGFTRPNEIQFESDNDDEDDAAREKHMWLEMERHTIADQEHDFSINIEEEFNKIRLSYERTPGDFLDLENEFGKLHAKPTGYGKSIDEDWANFEELQMKRRDADNGDGQSTKVVKFDAGTWGGETSSSDEERAPRSQRRPTGYVRSFEELYEEMNGACGAVSTQHSQATEMFEEYNNNNSSKSNRTIPNSPNSILKERRPTGYVQRSSVVLSESEDSTDQRGESQTFEAKPKQRHKVTFDFNAEEHYLPDYASDADKEEQQQQQLPQPMQRLTKIRYTDETNNNNSNNNRPLLFGSSMDMPNDAAQLFSETDSWSAIRQHRNLTEEFQQLSLGASVEESPMKPMPRHLEPPKPAYRNPLAQAHVADSRADMPTTVGPSERNRTEYGAEVKIHGSTEA